MPLAYDSVHENENLTVPSTVQRRWSAGQPLSILDGVPYAVKDGFHAVPYLTTMGTAWVRICSSQPSPIASSCVHPSSDVLEYVGRLNRIKIKLGIALVVSL